MNSFLYYGVVTLLYLAEHVREQGLFRGVITLEKVNIVDHVVM